MNNDEKPKKSIEELEAENLRLIEENERLKDRSIKERLYDHVHVSVKTMDIIIAVLFILLAAVVIIALIDR